MRPHHWQRGDNPHPLAPVWGAFRPQRRPSGPPVLQISLWNRRSVSELRRIPSQTIVRSARLNFPLSLRSFCCPKLSIFFHLIRCDYGDYVGKIVTSTLLSRSFHPPPMAGDYLSSNPTGSNISHICSV